MTEPSKRLRARHRVATLVLPSTVGIDFAVAVQVFIPWTAFLADDAPRLRDPARWSSPDRTQPRIGAALVATQVELLPGEVGAALRGNVAAGTCLTRQCIASTHRRLETTGRTVARELGFESDEMFRTQFADTTGTTPARYRHESRHSAAQPE